MGRDGEPCRRSMAIGTRCPGVFGGGRARAGVDDMQPASGGCGHSMVDAGCHHRSRASTCRWREQKKGGGGQANQAFNHRRGGFSTKIPAVCEALGPPWGVSSRGARPRMARRRSPRWRAAKPMPCWRIKAPTRMISWTRCRAWAPPGSSRRKRTRRRRERLTKHSTRNVTSSR